MTRKDYIQIEENLRLQKLESEKVFRDNVSLWMKMLKADNANFDEMKFLTAIYQK
jgi:hypothetical protein